MGSASISKPINSHGAVTFSPAIQVPYPTLQKQGSEIFTLNRFRAKDRSTPNHPGKYWIAPSIRGRQGKLKRVLDSC
jgi:hypothetical protein